jgi:hypothetical protein
MTTSTKRSNPDIGLRTLRAEAASQARHADVTGLCGCGVPPLSVSSSTKNAGRAEAESRDFDPLYQLLLFTDNGWLDYASSFGTARLRLRGFRT